MTCILSSFTLKFYFHEPSVCKFYNCIRDRNVSHGYKTESDILPCARN